MKEIRGDAKSIHSMLNGVKFSIDYYQREYRWEKKQVIELINDLCGKFLDSYEPNHARKEVGNYGHYFLGSVIISSDKDGQKFIIDGQQRITTLTLLLINIYHQLPDEDKQPIANMISSRQYGQHSFNLNVQERDTCMEALMAGETFDEEGQPESVVNILNRYQDIEAHLPDTIASVSEDRNTLPYFADWLIDNVHLVEITADSDKDAYTIFETMNDRGLSLTHPQICLKDISWLISMTLTNVIVPIMLGGLASLSCKNLARKKMPMQSKVGYAVSTLIIHFTSKLSAQSSTDGFDLRRRN